MAGIDAAATHAHAVLSADVSRDTALAGVNLDFSQRRTALSLEITSAGADAVQAKMIQSAVEGTKASLEATERAWNEWIATLHERRSAGYGFWELVGGGWTAGYGSAVDPLGDDGPPCSIVPDDSQGLPGGIGQPRFLEGMIPVWGSARNRSRGGQQ